MCLKWDFSRIEGNYATICKQLQIRIISENIFSLILIVYRHRKLGYPFPLFRGTRASPLENDTGIIHIFYAGKIVSKYPVGYLYCDVIGNCIKRHG